jgi:transposase
MTIRRRRSAIITSPFDLTNEQWQVVSPLIPPRPISPHVRGTAPVQSFTLTGGRPPIADRPVLNGILWKLRTGIPWYSLPDSFPSFQTCRRRYYDWVQAGAMPRILRALATDLAERTGLDLFACIDPKTLRIQDRNALFSLLLKPEIQNSWQMATLLLFIAPLKENPQ